MKKILEEILNKEVAPKEIKSRLLDSARTYLLVKDLGDLFGSNIPKVSLDITDTIACDDKTKTKNKPMR